ncbi:MAG: hypothetical protein U9N30_02540 [Campylobacterota bacterium]|nr:hypothetical protein [Campylobacterota bacterium]
MQIKYSGPRPVISEHGISFKDGKEDKYVYLMISLQILQAIDQSFDTTKSYSYDLNNKKLSNDEMCTILRHYEKDIKQISLDQIKHYKIKLDEEVEHLDNSSHLSQMERKTFKNNLNIMKEYRIQRAVNKIYYMHSIQDIVYILRRESIKELDAPFYEKFWHVFQTIQGELEKGRGSVHTEIKIEPNEEGKLMVKLLISV